MRMAIVSLAAALAAGVAASALAQDNGQMRGVYPPLQSWPTEAARPGAGKLAKPSAKPSLEAPKNGPLDGGPIVTIPGKVTRGTVLPGDVHPAPIAGRPGYGAAIVNGQRVIVDTNSNSVFQGPD